MGATSRSQSPGMATPIRYPRPSLPPGAWELPISLPAADSCPVLQCGLEAAAGETGSGNVPSSAPCLGGEGAETQTQSCLGLTSLSRGTMDMKYHVRGRR